MFWEYELTCPALCLGERNKKGTFRASLTHTIPYSQITGALRARFERDGRELGLHAVGLIKSSSSGKKTRALRDAFGDYSKLVIETEYLTDVKGCVYVPATEDTAMLEEDFEILMGAYRTLGWGRCKLTRIKKNQQDYPLVEGRLAMRVPEALEILNLFQIQVRMPIYGYLFQPDAAHEGGVYTRALFEGSLVIAPKPFLKPLTEV